MCKHVRHILKHLQRIYILQIFHWQCNQITNLENMCIKNFVYQKNVRTPQSGSSSLKARVNIEV